MRDVGLARRQFLGGLVAFITAGVLLLVVAWPQFSAWQELKAQKNGLSPHKPDALSMLPDLTVLGDKRFKAENTQSLTKVCEQQGLKVLRIDTGDPHPNMYSKFPPGVEEVAISIRAEGQRADAKALLKALTETLPGLEVTQVSLKSTGKSSGPTSTNVKVTKPASVQLHVRATVLVWKPEL